MELRVRNVNHAVEAALWNMKVSGVLEHSRNGEVLVFPEPMMTTYERPTERVLFWPERDANPIFHLMESIWMLAGRDDVAFVEYFNSRMRNFSDDGETLNGAYGHRWRRRFGVDQITLIIEELQRNPSSRRAVLSMWAPLTDLCMLESKDVCCNTHCYFDLRGGRLNMTVLNRSNDLIWGAYGANVVHFSVLQEFIASALNVPVGVYRQFSNNLHIYTTLYDYSKHVESPPSASDFDAYQQGIRPRPLLEHDRWDTFLLECESFCNDPYAGTLGYTHAFFRDVAYPMAMITKTRKEKRGDGYYWAERVEAEDWQLAAKQWIERREAKNA